MVWVLAAVTSSYDSANASSYRVPNSSSINISPSTMYVLVATGHKTVFPSDSPTISGTLTPWTFLNSSSMWMAGAGFRKTYSWYAIPTASETSRQLTLTYANGQSNNIALLMSVTGYDTTTTNIFVQSGSTVMPSGSNSASSSLANPPSAGNLILAFFGNASSSGVPSNNIIPDANFTEVDDLPSSTAGINATDVQSLESEYALTSRQSVTASLITSAAATSQWSALIFELKAAASAVAGSVQTSGQLWPDGLSVFVGQNLGQLFPRRRL